MKTHLIRFSMLALLAASAVRAESYRAEVPFDFVVGKQTLPAGVYVVDPSAYNFVLIQSSDNKQSIFSTAMNSTLAKCPDTGTLVFHRYGDHYFLTEIWTRGSASARKLPEGKRERELAVHGTMRHTPAMVALR